MAVVDQLVDHTAPEFADATGNQYAHLREYRFPEGLSTVTIGPPWLQRFYELKIYAFGITRRAAQ